MTISEAAQERAGYWRQQKDITVNGLFGLLVGLGSRWRRWRLAQTNSRRLDEMPPEQLADLGLRRVTHSVRFLNPNGTLKVGEFDYRAAPPDLESHG